MEWAQTLEKYGLLSKMQACFVLKHVSLWPSPQDQDGEQDEEYETEEELQARILDAALEFVPVHGWSAEAIAAGAEVRGEIHGKYTTGGSGLYPDYKTFIGHNKMIYFFCIKFLLRTKFCNFH